MKDQGWSVRDAAARLLCSEASIRRRIGADGDLVKVPGAKPTLITKDSVAAVQAQMLTSMGLAPPQPTAAQRSDGPAETPSNDRLITQLESEIRTLQGAVADLTAANAAMLDTYRRMSAGAVPNN